MPRKIVETGQRAALVRFMKRSRNTLNVVTINRVTYNWFFDNLQPVGQFARGRTR